MIVAFEGIDGAGKTTIAPLTAAILRRHGIDAGFTAKQAPDIHDDFAGEQLMLVSRRLWGIPHDARVGSLGTGYWIYLNASYFAGVHAALSRQERPGQVTIFDNWINKFVARVTASGQVGATEIASVLTLVPEPDLIVLLDITPETAALRRPASSQLEQGVLGTGQPGFIGYQGRVRDHLLRRASECAWPVISMGEREADDVALEAASLIQHRFGLPGNPDASGPVIDSRL